MAKIPVVLCIDDEALGLQIRQAVLEKAGYQVLIAIDGPTGINLFQSQPIDAVVLDYGMPGMDGSQVAQALREIRPSIPILLLSAYISLPQEVLSMVDARVVKGEGPEALLEALGNLLLIKGVV